MAFDGLTIAALVSELRTRTLGGRITKIAQPEKDEILLTIKAQETLRVLISADAGLPLMYITETKKESPAVSPAFCMLLRKHLQGGKIKAITQPQNERVVYIDVEHYDELEDLTVKRLIVEIMGKHSNIILCDASGIIVDSIKRIPATVSSVREVLPGREYFIAKTQVKADPCAISEDEAVGLLSKNENTPERALVDSFNGISPVVAREAVYRSHVSSDGACCALPTEHLIHLVRTFKRIVSDVAEGDYSPQIVLKDSAPEEYAAIELTHLEHLDGVTTQSYAGMSELLEQYYTRRNLVMRIRQRSSQLRHNALVIKDRIEKKYQLQQEQLADTDKREKYRLYGELLCAYAHELKFTEGKSVKVTDYNTGEEITIPIDPDLSAIDNSKRYYDRYGKLKRTYEALTERIKTTVDELGHIGSVILELDLATCEDDLDLIRKELEDAGYLKRQGKGKSGAKKKNSSKMGPMHYISSDGFDIYVGRNNYQNDELTFNMAEGNDWWFHLKGAPGSHVVLKTRGASVPDRSIEEAAAVAAYYSTARESAKAEVDYLLRRNVKKPSGARPGYVIYYTNYSMVVRPSANLKTDSDI